MRVVIAAVLRDILEAKRAEVSAGMSARPMESVRGAARSAPAARDFAGALTGSERTTAVIAEIKRRSPSAGWIRPEYEGPGFAPEDIARRYHAGGAAAISCLTDERFFGGRLEFLERVKAAVPLPVLRKDFLIGEWQVWESRAAGADAVLLIAGCLESGLMSSMMGVARELGMGVLVEVHDERELERVGPMVSGRPGVLLGINNRDLRTMRVDLGQTERLVPRVADVSRVVSESGIRTAADLERLRGSGVRMVLVGEHLMREADPGAALARLRGGA